MIVDNILVAEFEGGSIEIPFHPSAFVYEDFVDNFRVLEYEWIEEQRKWTTTPYDDEIENSVDVKEKEKLKKLRDEYELTPEQIAGLEASKILLIDALSSIVEGDFDLIPYRPSGKIDENFMYDAEELQELSVLHIYTHVRNVVKNYSQLVSLDEPIFTIDGEGFYFASDNIITSGTGFTVGESVSVLEFRREAGEKQKNEGYDGNMDFSLSMKELAVLARKKGEKLPYKKAERHMWINDRMKLFHEARLSYADVLNVKFFFLNFISDLSLLDFTDGTLTKPIIMSRVRMGRRTSHLLN